MFLYKIVNFVRWQKLSVWCGFSFNITALKNFYAIFRDSGKSHSAMHLTVLGVFEVEWTNIFQKFFSKHCVFQKIFVDKI